MRLYEDQPAGMVIRARQLRRDASEPERRLLRALREAFPHLKWRHQALVNRYYAALLCFSERLVIEVDGETHADEAADDAIRTCAIGREGFRVIRFTNADVMTNLEGVVTRISLSLREREGAPTAKKGEGDRANDKGDHASTRSPSPFRRYAAPFLSRWERDRTYSSSSNCTASAPFALSRTTPSSISAISPVEM